LNDVIAEYSCGIAKNVESDCGSSILFVVKSIEYVSSLIPGIAPGATNGPANPSPTFP